MSWACVNDNLCLRYTLEFSVNMVLTIHGKLFHGI